RAAEDQEELATMLRAQGAEPVALPCIEFADPVDPAPLEAALRNIRSGSPPDFLVLASPHAADRFFARLEPLHLRTVRIAAAGQGTARRVEQRGLTAVAPVQGAGAEALVDLIAPQVRGRTVLVPRAEAGNPALVEGLERAGAQVTVVPLYRTVPATRADPETAALLRAGRIDAIAFASGSAARGFAALFGDQAASLAARSVVACMGRTCAADAQSAGLRVDAVADGGLPELVRALEAALSAASRGSGRAP
ncbi:MAG TPA: uroporphyrinogen-III synthase, partial [Myxococcales bacterium]|nr:uroporphyrinogen-III synthase [Myxococcales bacterium]